MPVASIAQRADPVAIGDLYRLSVRQYHAMIDAEILDENDPVELLEGLLYEKHVESFPHPPGVIDLGQLFRLTRDRYEAMNRAGVLTADDRVEFVEGVLLNRLTILPPHTGSVIRLNSVLRPVIPAGYRYRQEQPILLADGEPLPDGVIAIGTEADNFRFHPPARDVLVVIEVADATLARDRGLKRRSYARAAIPVYWIVNLVDRQVEVHSGPNPLSIPHPTYRQRDVYRPGELVPLTVAGIQLPPVPVAALLPPV